MFMGHSSGVLTYHKSVEYFYIAWRETITRIWRLDKIAHNVLIDLFNRCLPNN